MTEIKKRLLGDPVCGNCNYSLKGLTDTARCPECGQPIVETLIRTGFSGFRGIRYRSESTLLAFPLIAIASGPTAEQRVGHAKGILAIGDIATGVIAIGAVARGVIAIGSVSVGIVAMGGAACGVAAMGGLAMGYFACGGIAVGAYSWGGLALYWVRGFGGLRKPLPWLW